MVRYALLVVLASVLAGCGGGDGGGASSPSPSPTAAADQESPAAAPKAPVLVQLVQQRPGALLDKVTVRRDGTGVFDRPSGGVGRVLRDIRIDPSVVDRLERDLRALPDGPLPKPRTRPAANGATYIVRYRGRTLVARQGAEPKPLREPARLLAGLLVGDGVSEIVRERLGGAAGSTHAANIGKAKELVFFQRQGAAGATLDTVSVRADGTITRQRRYGGAGARFSELRMKDGQLEKLERALRTVPAGSSMTVGSPPPGGAQYLLRMHGHAIVGRAGGIARAARPAVKLLNGYIDGIGVVRVKQDEQTHSQ
jgi:hypothetical protein